MPAPGPVVVHFPHPGREHNPGRSSRQPWNTSSEHRRKFLRNPGSYVADDGTLAEAELAFWGEWEAPSYPIDGWAPSGDLPCFLQEPVWERPRFNGPRQNTDPWVFGHCFRYSNCKQLSQRGLRNLAPGSLILFGSTLGLRSSAGPRFVVDTVFVVGHERQQYTPKKPPDTDEAFRICTIESLASDSAFCGATAKVCAAAGSWFTLYSGATYDAPVNGMYCFAPSRRADQEGCRFMRPTLSLPADYVNPMSWQSPKGANTPRSAQIIRQIWQAARDQVIKAGCLIGVNFITPAEDRANADLG